MVGEAANHRRVDGPLQLNPDDVFAIDREVVPNHGSAARAERQIVAHPVLLDQRARQRVGADERTHRWIADRQAADLARRRHVAVEQRRRQREHVADIVEPEARLVTRQQRTAVDVERQQVTDRIGVLGPIEPVRRGRAAGHRPGGGGLVERALEPGPDGVIRRFVGAPRAGRRHRAGLQLPHDPFPHLRLFADTLEIELLENEPAALQCLTVTGNAVAIDDAANGDGRARQLGGLRGCRSRRASGRASAPGRAAGRQVPSHIMAAASRTRPRNVLVISCSAVLLRRVLLRGPTPMPECRAASASIGSRIHGRNGCSQRCGRAGALGASSSR